MSKSPYKKPPITEAVVEFRFSTEISVNDVEKIKDLLSSSYPVPPQTVQNITFATNEQPRVEFDGYRLSTTDATSVVIIGKQVLTTSRLAPYEGWEDFIGRAKRNWEVCRKIAGWREVARIGIRYINRIDVPNPKEEPIQIDEYLQFRPVFPDFDGAQAVDSFAINGLLKVAGSDFRLILNAGTAPSPLVRTSSFLLDLDISQDHTLPKKDDVVWALVDRVRPLKNQIFEACITDTARKLFQ